MSAAPCASPDPWSCWQPVLEKRDAARCVSFTLSATAEGKLALETHHSFEYSLAFSEVLILLVRLQLCTKSVCDEWIETEARAHVSPSSAFIIYVASSEEALVVVRWWREGEESETHSVILPRVKSLASAMVEESVGGESLGGGTRGVGRRRNSRVKGSWWVEERGTESEGGTGGYQRRGWWWWVPSWRDEVDEWKGARQDEERRGRSKRRQPVRSNHLYSKNTSCDSETARVLLECANQVV